MPTIKQRYKEAKMKFKEFNRETDEKFERLEMRAKPYIKKTTTYISRGGFNIDQDRLKQSKMFTTQSIKQGLGGKVGKSYSKSKTAKKFRRAKKEILG